MVIYNFWDTLKRTLGMGFPLTWDSYTNERIKTLHPQIRTDTAKAINEIEEKKGLTVRIGKDGHYRSIDKQRQLYQEHQQGGPLAAPPGKSYHNYGLAVDLYIIEDGEVDYSTSKYRKVADVMRKYGFEWGYALWGQDKPHFQKTFNQDQEELLAQVERQDVKYPNVG